MSTPEGEAFVATMQQKWNKLLMLVMAKQGLDKVVIGPNDIKHFDDPRVLVAHFSNEGLTIALMPEEEAFELAAQPGKTISGKIS